MRDLEIIRRKQGFISDMDGVIYHGSSLLPGVREFVDWLKKEKKQFLFLTNSSERTPLELHKKLLALGIDIEESHFYTSALATAQFLRTQAPGCSAYVIGAHGLLNALYDVGIPFNDVNPDYVVVGETAGYNYEMIVKATELIYKGARLIGTNSDMTSPSDRGIIPACRAFIAPIELATGKSAYFVGKPNPLMMRTGLKKLGVHSADAVMIGDRMDTDIIAGVETGLETVLVLTGVSTRESIRQFSYQPHYVLNGVGDIVPDKGKKEK
jgi:NagD protein